MSTVRLTVDIHVIDPKRLRTYATDRFRACWQDGPETLYPVFDVEAQVYEAMIASNENPSPDLIGIEIGDYRTEILP